MQPNIRAVIFDYDGTIALDLAFHIKSFQHVFARRGFKLGEKEIIMQLNATPGAKNLISNVIERHSLGLDADGLTKEKVAKYLELVKGKNVLNPELEKTLEKLSGGHKLGVVTASDRGQIEKALNPKVKKHFSVFITLNECTKTKPAPDCLLMAAKKLGVKPEECCYVGDMQTDMQAAKAGGMLAIGYKTKFGSAKWLKEGGADKVIKNLNELPKILGAAK